MEERYDGSDSTEPLRRVLTPLINAVEGSREDLESNHDKVWDTTELQEDFTVHGFMAPFIMVTEKATGAKGILAFQHSPRFYFDFTRE